jgi:hypothetical protein
VICYWIQTALGPWLICDTVTCMWVNTATGMMWVCG